MRPAAATTSWRASSADKMSRTLGQQVVIENRAGAGGSIATRQVAKAAPDGYTLVIGGTGTLAVNPTLYANVGYDPRKDFAPVGLIGTSALIVLVQPVAARAVDQGPDRARQEASRASSTTRPPASAAASISAPSCSQMMARHQAHPCAVQGTGPALTDLIGGHVAIYFSLAAAGGRHRPRGQGARAGGHRREALRRLPRCADGGGGRAAGLRGGAALRHRGAGRHAAADHRQAQCGAARSGRRTRHQASAWRTTAPSRCRARRRNMPPTSTARRPSGRRW